MPRKSETKRALSGTEDECGGGQGLEGKMEGARREAHGDGAGEGRWRGRASLRSGLLALLIAKDATRSKGHRY